MKTNHLNIAFSIAVAMLLCTPALNAQGRHEHSGVTIKTTESRSAASKYTDAKRPSNNQSSQVQTSAITPSHTAYNAHSDYKSNGNHNNKYDNRKRYEHRTVVVNHYPERRPALIVERRPMFEIGYMMNRLPDRTVMITLDGIRYYYYGGTFFRKGHRGGFVVVAPPAYIRHLPHGGNTYHVDGRVIVDINGIMFTATSGGYAYYR